MKAASKKSVSAVFFFLRAKLRDVYSRIRVSPRVKSKHWATAVFLIGAFCALPPIAQDRFPIVGPPPPRYQLLIQDNPANRRFNVVLLSHDDRPVCISHGGWPDALGPVDWYGRDVKIESLQRSFPARDWDFGYCPRSECTT
jgi:hypothetical protein